VPGIHVTVGPHFTGGFDIERHEEAGNGNLHHSRTGTNTKSLAIEITMSQAQGENGGKCSCNVSHVLAM
jgi:hypothetical protein